jgi:hypothetical protein
LHDIGCEVFGDDGRVLRRYVEKCGTTFAGQVLDKFARIISATIASDASDFWIAFAMSPSGNTQTK